MKKPSGTPENWSSVRDKIIGLGEGSLRKTYYPELQQKLDELERFRALLDQSNDCIFLLHASTLTFVDVNESACRQLSCTREEVISSSLANYVPQQVIERVKELVSSGPEEGWGHDTITTDLLKCTGDKLPVEITFRLVTFNKTLYGVAVARDITERKRAEKVLLENSRMLRDMELARQIQLSLLPIAPPQISGVLFAGCCVPAAHVGGDYYDYFFRGIDTVDLVVADVSGHSIGAALMTAEARSVLRAQFARGGEAGETLESLNTILYEDLSRAELFITLFCASYNASSKTLTYANAGHASPILCRKFDSTCQVLDAEGLILGIHEHVSFEEKQLQLQPGDALLLYTDGITEARNSMDEMYGLVRLSNIFLNQSAESPQAIIDAILEDVAIFTGVEMLEDDVTMIVMKVLDE